VDACYLNGHKETFVNFLLKRGCFRLLVFLLSTQFAWLPADDILVSFSMRYFHIENFRCVGSELRKIIFLTCDCY